MPSKAQLTPRADLPVVQNVQIKWSLTREPWCYEANEMYEGRTLVLMDWSWLAVMRWPMGWTIPQHQWRSHYTDDLSVSTYSSTTHSRLLWPNQSSLGLLSSSGHGFSSLFSYRIPAFIGFLYPPFLQNFSWSSLKGVALVLSL